MDVELQYFLSRHPPSVRSLSTGGKTVHKIAAFICFSTSFPRPSFLSSPGLGSVPLFYSNARAGRENRRRKRKEDRWKSSAVGTGRPKEPKERYLFHTAPGELTQRSHDYKFTDAPSMAVSDIIIIIFLKLTTRPSPKEVTQAKERPGCPQNRCRILTDFYFHRRSATEGQTRHRTLSSHSSLSLFLASSTSPFQQSFRMAAANPFFRPNPWPRLISVFFLSLVLPTQGLSFTFKRR
jgi:hypothetical protein